MSRYISHDTDLPRFFQFPDFLIKAPLSQTAKIIYMLLYDRMRLSQRNGMTEDGRVYVIFTVDELCETSGKSQTTVKNALGELTKAEYIAREAAGFGRARETFVLLPSLGQNSDPVGKPALIEPENGPSLSRKPVPHRDGKRTTNQVIYSSDNNQTTKSDKRARGRFENVYLSDAQYERLRLEIPSLDSLIDDMSSYLAARSKRYKNYEAALRIWYKRDKSRAQTPDYTCEEGESL